MKFCYPPITLIQDTLLNYGKLPYRMPKKCLTIFNLIYTCKLLKPNLDWEYTSLDELRRFYQQRKSLLPQHLYHASRVLYKDPYPSSYDTYCDLIDYANKITEEEQKNA